MYGLRELQADPEQKEGEERVAVLGESFPLREVAEGAEGGEGEQAPLFPGLWRSTEDGGEDAEQDEDRHGQRQAAGEHLRQVVALQAAVVWDDLRESVQEGGCGVGLKERGGDDTDRKCEPADGAEPLRFERCG